MSNHNPNAKLEPRKSKVSVALAINHGLGGPKAMAKAAADGQTVNIPSRPRMLNQGTKDRGWSALLVWHSCPEKFPQGNFVGSENVKVFLGELHRRAFREKPGVLYEVSVPETDTGG